MEYIFATNKRTTETICCAAFVLVWVFSLIDLLIFIVTRAEARSYGVTVFRDIKIIFGK